MKLSIIIFIVAVSLASCKSGSNNSSDDTSKLNQLMDQLGSTNHRMAKVLEAQDAGDYTYVKLDDNGKVFWAAITARPVEIGQTYLYVEGMMMKDFESKQLETTFDSVMFIQDFIGADDKQETRAAKAKQHEHNKTDMQSGIQVEPAKNGNTIAEIFSNKKSLNGSKVIVRGQVVKISENIMKRHWIHIQDGTRSDGNFDLTVTTTEPVNFGVGEIVTFEGKLSADKDFGSGYRYDVILEDATWQQTRTL